MTLVTRHAALSDIGLHRRTNEDAYVVDPPLFAVCDGMGGAQAGEIAAGLAAETLSGEWRRGGGLLAAAEAANGAVFARANEHLEETGMGTTLTAFVLDDDVARFVHIGDSRAYLLRDGRLEMLSEDHSLVGEMVREGKLTWEQAAVHPHRSVLSRVLGTEPLVKLDEFSQELKPGDVLLLCSDGLSGMTGDGEIREALGEPDPEATARRLIEAAKAGGGHDNITAVVVRFDEAPAAAGEALEDLAAETTRIEAAAAAEVVGEGGEGQAPTGEEQPPTGEDATPPGAAAAPEQLTLGGGGAGAEELDLPAAGVDGAPAPKPGEQASFDLMARAGAGLRPVHIPRRLVWAVAVLAVVVALGVAGVVVVNTCYFIGNDDGVLAVYSGLPVSVGPVDLYALAFGSSKTYTSLTPEQRRLVDERRVQSEGATLRLGDRLGMWP